MSQIQINSIVYTSNIKRIVIDGVLINKSNNTIHIIGGQSAFYLKFKNFNISDYVLTTGSDENSILYQSYSIDTSMYIVKIGDYSYAPNTNTTTFESCGVVPSQQLLKLVVNEQLNSDTNDNYIILDNDQSIIFTISIDLEIGLSVELQNIEMDDNIYDLTHPELSFSNVSGDPYSSVIPYKNTSTGTYFMAKDNNLYLFELYNVDVPCFTSTANFAVITKKNEVVIKNITELSCKDKLICISGFYNILNIFKMPLFKITNVVKFKQNCYGRNIPCKTTLLTLPHLIVVDNKRMTAFESTHVNNNINIIQKYIDYFYHIHVDSPNIYEYALVNDMYCDVWGNKHEYLQKYLNYVK